MTATKFWLHTLLAAALAFALALSAPARAADTEAVNEAAETAMAALIKQVSAHLDALYKAGRIDDHAAIEQMIRTDILPLIDRQRLTRRVFRHFWPQLVEAGRQDEAEERVINAIVRTYTVALSDYSGDTITLIGVTTQGQRTVAKTRLRRSGGQTIQIDFSLVEPGTAQWRIDDMAVDGIVVSLTLFNAVKSVWDQQGMNAALASVASVDVNGQAGASQQDGKPKKPKQ